MGKERWEGGMGRRKGGGKECGMPPHDLTHLRCSPLDGYLPRARLHSVHASLLLAAHAKVRYLHHITVPDKAVPSGQVAVDAVLGLEVLHTAAGINAHV